MRACLTLATLLALALNFGAVTDAQAQFAPAISVNDRVITQYELTQRKLLLTLFRTPGDIDKQARDGLIDDRLKQQELDRFDLKLTDEELTAALEEFAGRANMDLAQFTRTLRQNGIDIAALRDFVSVGTAWRDYVRRRFSSQVTITDADIERATAQRNNSSTAIEVLLSEIIIPAPPEQADRAKSAARQIAQLTSYAAFEAAARQVSALPSRDQGGRLGWLPISNYPPQLHQTLLDLKPGQVTAPIDITNGIALFQMRGVREVAQRAAAPASIEYATYYIPGGRSAKGLQTAADVANIVDTCDDLYGVARNQPSETLGRDTLAPAAIPDDVALELARLDPGEVSYNLTRNNGQTLVFLMLCGRTMAGQGNVDPNEIRNQIRNQR